MTLVQGNKVLGLRVFYYDIYKGEEIYRDFSVKDFHCRGDAREYIKANLKNFKAEMILEVKGEPYQDGDKTVTPITFTTQYEIDAKMPVQEATPEEIEDLIPKVVDIMRIQRGEV